MRTYCLIGLSLVLFFSCNTGESELPEATNSRDHSIFKSENLSTYSPEWVLSTQTLEVNGHIDVPPESRAILSTYFDGYLKGLVLLEGQELKKGQVIGRLENPDFIDLQEEFLATAQELEYLEADFKRKEELLSESATTLKEFQRVKSDFNIKKGKLSALGAKLDLIGLDRKQVMDGNFSYSVALKAPISGYVADVYAGNGEFLVSSSKIIEIVDPSHFHIELKVFERDLDRIRENQRLTFRIPQVTQKDFHGEVHMIGRDIDEKSRTLRVHCHIEEDQVSQLVAGMYVEAAIIVDTVRVLQIHKNSIYEDGKQYLNEIISENDSIYEVKKVWIETVNGSDTWVQITSGDLDSSKQYLGRRAGK